QDEAGFVAASGESSEKNLIYFTCEQPYETKMWIDDINQILATKDSKLDSRSIKEGYLQAGTHLQALKRMYVVVTPEKLIVYKSRAVSKDCVEFSLNADWNATEWKTTFINLVFSNLSISLFLI